MHTMPAYRNKTLLPRLCNIVLEESKCEKPLQTGTKQNPRGETHD